MSQTPPPAPAAEDDAVLEAARFALLRRLAPSLRHEAVAHLQPLAMVGSVLERRLAAPQPDAAQVADGVRRLMASSRGAVQSCLEVIAWLAPEPGQVQPLHALVAETVQLMRGSLAFRGFTLRDELAGHDTPVARAGLRYLLPASLLWLTDSAGPPAEVALSAQAEAGQVRLRLDLTPTDEGPQPLSTDAARRPLRLDEVQALARAEGIGWSHEGDAVVLAVPRATTRP